MRMDAGRPAGLLLSRPDWLWALRIYVAVIAVGNLTWESLQLPLYTIWMSGSRSEQAFAVIHCTGGDLLIALGSLAVALLLAGSPAWPRRAFGLIAGLTIAFGLGYTGFSEWLNVSVRRSWAYSELMPVLPVAGGIGLSPLLQWVVVPTLASWCVFRAQSRGKVTST
jgi:hypothetical protein